MTTAVRSPLFQPYDLAGHCLPSRLVLPPMASATADGAGFVTPATLAHYGRIVGARHGLAFVEYTYVHPYGRSEPNQLGLTSAVHAEGLAQLPALIRARGAVPGIQLTHAGGKTEAGLIGRTPLGASAVSIPAHRQDFPAPQPMSAAEIDEVFTAFVTAARRAEAAGFAAIEIHCAHGYFFNQWLSPLTNRREDDHGGSLAGRAGLLLRLIRTLRAELRPETILSLRFPGQDRLEGGLTLADGIALAEAAVTAGIDVLNVSSGLGGWRRGRDQRGEGYLVEDAAAIRQAVPVPVIGVGGIATLAYVDAVLGDGAIDLVAVGRAVLENPDWPEAA